MCVLRIWSIQRIHCKSYSEKAWACVQNGITQRGRLADGDMTTSPSGELSCLHTPIPELCNAILNTCQMPSRFYIIPSIVNKSQTHLLKPFLARDLMEGHIYRQNTLMFALVFCFELRARAARTCCHCHLAVKNLIHDGKRGQLNCQKVMNGTTMWSCDTELCTNGVEASKCWVFIAHFSIYPTSQCHCHAGTDILKLCGHTLQINQVVRIVRHRISCCTPTIHWKCDARMQNWQIKSPPALWKHFSFECLGIIVA